MKKVLLSIAIISVSIISNAQTQGPNSPAAATESANGCLACPGSDWVNYTNAEANDNTNTTSGLLAHPNSGPGGAFFSRYLYVSNFGFTIPATATITGILTEVKRNYSGGSVGGLGVKDSVVQLMDSLGVRIGTNKASNTPWTGISTYATYGNSSDLWGATLTPAAINYSGFGVAVMAKNMSASIYTADIDHIRVTVYYSNPVGTKEIMSQSSDVSVYPNPATSEIFIKNNTETIQSITIFDAQGKQVMKQEIKNNETKLNIGNLESGIYFIETKTEKGVERKKLVKK